MREFLYTAALLCVLAAIGLWIDNPDPPVACLTVDSPVTQEQGDVWRRTNRGWERSDLWNIDQSAEDESAPAAPSGFLAEMENWELPHPFLIVVFQITTCLAALVLFGSRKQE